MRHTLRLIALCSALLSPTAFAGEGTVYGAALSDTTVIEMKTLMASPDSYVGKTVKVTGKVKDVCPKAGCWLELEDGRNTLKVKVTDGEIIFPVDSKGKSATLEGEFVVMNLTKEEAVGRMRHLAEEKGESFDESTVTGPMKIYQIQGIGGVIK